MKRRKSRCYWKKRNRKNFKMLSRKRRI